MIELKLQTDRRTEFVDATPLVSRAVGEMGLVAGVILVFSPHTTAGVTINEGADPDVVRDMSVALEQMVPWDNGYHHAEGNAAAHMKATMCGSSVSVIVQDGKLRLGTWQKIWFCEFDGPRSRHLWVQVLTET